MLLGCLGELLARHLEPINLGDPIKKLCRTPAHRWKADITSASTGDSARYDGSGSRRMTAYRIFTHEWNKKTGEKRRVEVR